MSVCVEDREYNNYHPEFIFIYLCVFSCKTEPYLVASVGIISMCHHPWFMKCQGSRALPTWSYIVSFQIS